MLGKRARAGASISTAKKKAKWREEASDKEEAVEDTELDTSRALELTEQELEEFRRLNKEEEKDERRKKWAVMQNKTKAEEKAAQPKKKKEKAFEWMDSDDATDSDDEEEEEMIISSKPKEIPKERERSKSRSISKPKEISPPSDDEEDSLEAYAKKEALKEEEVSSPEKEDPDAKKDEKVPPILPEVAIPRPCSPPPEPVIAQAGQIPSVLAGREHLFKTRLCQKWSAGNCPFGNKCIYAHGQLELQPSVSLTSKVGVIALGTVPPPSEFTVGMAAIQPGTNISMPTFDWSGSGQVPATASNNPDIKDNPDGKRERGWDKGHNKPLHQLQSSTESWSGGGDWAAAALAWAGKDAPKPEKHNSPPPRRGQPSQGSSHGNGQDWEPPPAGGAVAGGTWGAAQEWAGAGGPDWNGTGAWSASGGGEWAGEWGAPPPNGGWDAGKW